MKIFFYGGAKWVTGSNYLLHSPAGQILIDCGLFQGARYAEDLNYKNFDYNPKEIKYVFITHSHIDHIGRLPKLFKDGFRGRVFTTSATADLMAVALPDNLGKIADEAKEASHEPLFKSEDLAGLMSLVEGVSYGQAINLENDVEVIFHDAGHILGSAIIDFNWLENGEKKKMLFSGDLGNPPTPLLRSPEYIGGADYLTVESTYGDRLHEDRSRRKEKLVGIIKDTINKGGVLMIPSFALERTQELLFELNNIINKKEISPVPIFIDSPLAIKMTAVYEKYPDYFNKEAMYLIDSGDDIFNFPGLKMTLSVEESKAINNVPPPKIIIAGSGMSQGGRIMHHEIRYLPDRKSSILFVGYQVEGSLGRRILDGEKKVKIFGQDVDVNCRVEDLGSYSGHADQRGLLKWVTAAAQGGKLKKVFVVQGEEKSANVLAKLIFSDLGVESTVPTLGQSFEL